MASLFSTSPAPTRPLILHSSTGTRVAVPVPASPLSAWLTGETLAQDFHDSLLAQDEAPVATEVEEGAVVTPPSIEPQVKLLSRFLSFAADKLSASASGDQELAQVLLAAYKRFNELFLPVINIHSLVQSFQPEVRLEVLKAYYKAFSAAREALGASQVKVAHPSALLEATKKGDAELYALFGGQGVNEVCPPMGRRSWR